MYTPKLAPLMATSEKTKPGRSNDKDFHHQTDEVIRRCLLFWACLRLVVSVIWTGVLAIVTWQFYGRYFHEGFEDSANAITVLLFAVPAIIIQIIELVMIITFINAGVKKSARLYRAYYGYSILTLITYIIAVILCLTLDYGNGPFFGEIYLTYHVADFPIVENDALLFGIAAVLDICLEVLLIGLVRRLVNRYSYDENITNSETV